MLVLFGLVATGAGVYRDLIEPLRSPDGVQQTPAVDRVSLERVVDSIWTEKLLDSTRSARAAVQERAAGAAGADDEPPADSIPLPASSWNPALVSASGRSTPDPPPVDFLVGRWSLRTTEFGQLREWTWSIFADGTTTYDVDGIVRERSTWSYVDGLLYENFPDSSTAASLIRTIDRNAFELVMVDNQGGTATRGMKRTYRRIPD